MSACTGSYRPAIRVHPRLGAGECSDCGRRFDRADLAGEHKQNVPLHSPRFNEWPCSYQHAASEHCSDC